ncbi:MAG TPA: glycosyltransferase family 2 protein [Gemmatimonadaceae bacterium]|jgi:cellulose synthase/poly-beta-1,6-N-acetylglucosamine synthase-like glycosyltransferase|nr:glycosyltransferase family 2 protein [Gemmatimonadaceae bacterium]
MTDILRTVVNAMLFKAQGPVLAYFFAINAWYLVLLVSALLELRRHMLLITDESRHLLLSSTLSPTISILAPAYNEEATIETSLRALLALQYPNLEVIVISDGSKDRTVQVLIDRFNLVPVKTIYEQRIKTKPVRMLYRSATYPSLVVVDKENGGKADALNVGLSFARGELVCAMDADTLIEGDGLQRMVRPFLYATDVVATGGTIRVVNGSEVKHGRVLKARVPTHLLPGVQVVEYLRAFLFGRLGWNRLGGNIIISGAFGLFQRDAVVNAGGYLHDTVGEDMELVLRLKRLSYEKGGPGRIAFVPDPVAWTEVPETAAVLGRQRDRWHRGLADVLWRHRRMMLNPRYGVTGLFVYPYYAFVELLAPVIEVIGLLTLALGLAFGVLDWKFAVLFYLTAYGLGTAMTAFTLILEDLSFHRYATFRDRALLFCWALLENLGYRQMTVYWRLRGLWKFIRGRKEWGAMERKGFQAVPAAKQGSAAA